MTGQAGRSARISAPGSRRARIARRAAPSDHRGGEGALLGTTLSTYGWAYLVGVILILSSFAVLNRSQFARWIGIISGVVLTVSAMWRMPICRVWSLGYVIIGILVIYALAVDGGRNVPA